MGTRSRHSNFARKPFSSSLENSGDSAQIMVGGSRDGFGTDTTLRLCPLASSTSSVQSQKGIKRKPSTISDSLGQLVGFPPCLQVGNSSGSSGCKGSSETACTSISSAKESGEESSMNLELDFGLHIVNEKVPSPKRSLCFYSKSRCAWPKVDLELGLSSGTAESDITTHGAKSIYSQNIAKQNHTVGALHADYGSTSLVGQPNHGFPPSSRVRNGVAVSLSNRGVSGGNLVTTSKDLSRSIITPSKTTLSFSSGITESQPQRNIRNRKCDFLGCVKYARGSTVFCSAHGGGRRCCHESCTGAARGKSGLCIRHGGGKRCQKDNCTKSTDCRTGLCISHGGGRRCQYPECSKGAQGSTMFCIAHGGGKRCTFLGCTRGVEGRTTFCKSHGGSKRCYQNRKCEFPGCVKQARGSTIFCIAHGGGRRCCHEACTRAARGKSGLCIRHGGGKRCQKDNCTKSAYSRTGFCISHGGGRRCQYPECSKGAQGSTMFCKAHGGGKRCTFLGCTSGCEGRTPFCKSHGGGKRCSFQGGGVCPKSVDGGTLFCVAHGSGKRCATPDCTEGAIRRTDFCVRHGGGKRCKFDGCVKSVQGCTDFCNAHGGGTRCSWGHPGSEFGKSYPPCNLYSRGKTCLCALHGALLQDNCVHGGTLPQDSNPEEPVGSGLVTPTICSGWKPFDVEAGGLPVEDSSSTERTTSEGRVHGGSLVTPLSGN